MADQARPELRWSALGEQAQREAARLESTLSMRAISSSSLDTEQQQSYYDTRWPLVNHAWALVDHVTRGRAGLLQRLSTYLVIGGTAAVVNLSILAILFRVGSANVFWYWLFANGVAYELSIMANFIPNDYFTFRHLAGHQRSWLTRCARFHVTSISGVMVTLIISALLFHLLGLPALVAQACALIVATAYNFTVHHLFTYAHK